jgi:hypothetical protein
MDDDENTPLVNQIDNDLRDLSIALLQGFFGIVVVLTLGLVALWFGRVPA